MDGSADGRDRKMAGGRTRLIATLDGRYFSARRWPLLARASLKAGLADWGVGRVHLVCWKLQIADHTEWIASRRPVGLRISGHSFTLRFFSGSSGDLRPALLVG